MTVVFFIDQFQISPGAFRITGIQIVFRPFFTAASRYLDDKDSPFPLRNVPVQNPVFYIIRKIHQRIPIKAVFMVCTFSRKHTEKLFL